MHRALQITEVLTIILRAVDQCYQQRVAAAMAATCRTFCEPANDIVWEDLLSPGPLLGCLPGEVSSQSCVLQECARFRRHAARVRKLKLGGEDSDDIYEHLHTLLSIRSRGTSALLPNLKKLEIEYDFLEPERSTDPSSAPYLYLFLSPKLQSAQLETWGQGSEELLRQLAISCPQLRYLGMNSFPETTGLIRCFSALEEISFADNAVSTAILGEMAFLPSLRSLYVMLPSDFSGIGHHGSRDKMYTALETLEIHEAAEARHIINFLRSIGSKQLRSLSLHLPRGEADGVIKTLDAASKFTKLRSLELRADDTDSHFSFPPQALFRLQHLEELKIKTSNLYTTDKSAEALARACPKLRRVTLWYSTQRCWSLNVLEHFAMHLPALEFLNVELGTEGVLALDAPQACSWAPICLELDGSQLSKEHWEPTAAYIAQVYPNATFKPCFLWGDFLDDELVGFRDHVLHWRYVGQAVAKARSDER